MKIYRLADYWTAYINPYTKKLSIDDDRGSGFVLDEEGISLVRYEQDIRFGYFEYQNEYLEFKMLRHTFMGEFWKRICEGDFHLLNADEKSVALDPIVFYTLVYGAYDKVKKSDDIIVNTIRGYPEPRQYTAVRLDKRTGEYSQISSDRRTVFFAIDGECYGWFSSRNGEIYKLDQNLEKLWSFKYEGMAPSTVNIDRYVNNKDAIIFNLCSKPKGRFDKFDLDGEIFSLAKKDGSVNWKRNFPFQVDDICRATGNTLVLFCGHEHVVLNGDTGETIKSIATGLEEQTGTVFLRVLGPYLFLFSRKSNVMQIYEIESWSCVREVSGEDVGGCFYHQPQTVDDKLFVPIDSRLKSRLLVIDVNDIQSPIEFEKEPEFKISIPDKENMAIVMEVNHPVLGDVLRLAEIYALTHAEEQGNEGRGLDNNPYFDGRVILKYSGCSADREEAIQKLDILKERFDFYAQDSVFKCRSGDGKRYATFEYELL